jgi:hypothetical protein
MQLSWFPPLASPATTTTSCLLVVLVVLLRRSRRCLRRLLDRPASTSPTTAAAAEPVRRHAASLDVLNLQVLPGRRQVQMLRTCFSCLAASISRRAEPRRRVRETIARLCVIYSIFAPPFRDRCVSWSTRTAFWLVRPGGQSVLAPGMATAHAPRSRRPACRTETDPFARNCQRPWTSFTFVCKPFTTFAACNSSSWACLPAVLLPGLRFSLLLSPLPLPPALRTRPPCRFSAPSTITAIPIPPTPV